MEDDNILEGPPSESDRAYDLIIFGASGFTGQYVVDEVARTAEGEGMTWAVAGRSIAKLVQTIRDASDRTGVLYVLVWVEYYIVFCREMDTRV